MWASSHSSAHTAESTSTPVTVPRPASSASSPPLSANAAAPVASPSPAASQPPVPVNPGPDLEALRRVLSATAQPPTGRTSTGMPNPAPPAHPLARRRAAAQSPGAQPGSTSPAPGSASPTGRPSAKPPTVSSRRTEADRGSRGPTGTATVPASWTGFAQLLAGAGERVPPQTLNLAIAADRAPGQNTAVELSGIWALPVEVAPVRGHAVLRALDSKGRLQLPVINDAAAMLPVERDGALVVVFLPGAEGAPRPGFSAAPLPLDARGRLTLTAGVRSAAGIPDRADVLAYLDRDAGTVTITAASRLDTALAGALDALRRTAVDRTGDLPGEDATVASTAPAAIPADGVPATPHPRLRSVG